MTADEERERWEMQPDVGVGPLRFGMSPAEVAQALFVSEPQSRVGGEYAQENFPGEVRAFYDEGRLACVALDAVAGPQVFLAGFPLAGSPANRGQQYLADHAGEHENCVLFTADGSIALVDLGILLRDQRVGDVLLSRPLFVKQEWFESEYYRDHLPLEGITD